MEMIVNITVVILDIINISFDGYIERFCMRQVFYHAGGFRGSVFNGI